MSESIDTDRANEILLEAFQSECIRNDKLTNAIRSILLGTHKTYKYILITGLLAKATNQSVNPLALQSGAPLAGAYDARSLCHKVIVPFEREYLSNALGGSNEPFLNKPARFTHLSDNNAVRRGSDKETLVSLIDILGGYSGAY
jgi:hypothetical protein